VIEFIESTHVYLVDGVITPSVSQILAATIFKDKYNGIPDYILDRARVYGTSVHKAIEINDWIGLSDEEYISYENWLKLVRTHKISVISNEQIVAYGTQYAGTYDMEAWVDTDNCLIDIKTTYKIDMEYLSWQLSYYEMAYCKMYNKPLFDKLYCVWLTKKGEYKLLEIQRIEKNRLEELLKIYYENIAHL